MKNAVWSICGLILSLSASAGDLPEPMIYGVRFNAFATGPDKIALVARGTTRLNAEELQAAFEVYAKHLCTDAHPSPALTQSVYNYLEGGNQVLMPAGGILLSMTRYHEVKAAAALSGSVECNGGTVPPLPAPAIKVFVASDLGEDIPYFDQGFASFNRARLNVPVVGASLLDVMNRSVSAALQERGYQPTLVDSAEQADVVVSVTKAHVPQEQFDGIALMTKLGLLGITNLSAEFCSVIVTAQRRGNLAQRYSTGVSTRNLIKPIYRNWAKEMAAGPAADLHKKTSDDLAATLYTDVAAAIHALPPAAFDGPSAAFVAGAASK